VIIPARVSRGRSRGIRRRAEAKLADIDAKLARLKGMRRALGRLLSACEGRCAIQDCVILEAIDQRAG
jgi:hypothetical protein